MTSDKALADGLIRTYGGADRVIVLKLLKQAASAARADERRRIGQLIGESRDALIASASADESKVEVYRRKVALRTIRELLSILT